MSKQINIGPIKHRAVLYLEDNGLIQFPGWAITTTTLGAMAEPFDVNLRKLPSEDMQDFDPSDPAVRIDELRNIASHKINGFLLGDERTMGGDRMPRVFNRTGDFV